MGKYKHVLVTAAVAAIVVYIANSTQFGANLFGVGTHSKKVA